MKVIRVKNYEEMSRLGADLIGAQLLMKPNCVLGLATGSTPEGIYHQLAQRYLDGQLDFSQAKSVNLDEYAGLDEANDQSYRYYMNHHLFSRVNLPREHTFLPNGKAENSAEECRRYEKLIQSLGGVDLQLLGMGQNGHIAFNEPAESFAPVTHLVSLTDNTIEANARFFADKNQVPRQAYTMGIGTILRASKILMVVSGKNKAAALRDAIEGPVTPKVPASALQLHRDVTVIADEDALSLM